MMNQPASKEPTMDEILSSIRQIIADDDEAAAHKMPSIKPAAPRAVDMPVAPRPIAMEPRPVANSDMGIANIDPFSDDDEDEMTPLALSPDQIVSEPSEPELETAGLAESDAELVVPDDVAFEQDQDDEPVAQARAKAAFAFAPEPEPVGEPAPEAAKPSDRPSVAQGAPMPDPDLSADLAEELLEPATSAAVRSAFGKLGGPKLTPELALGAHGLTIEAMIREMLRPMLKEWLDENLPSMVERIVTQEIERVSRGG